MTLMCVNGAQVQLQPMGPQQLIPPVSVIPAQAQNKLAVDGRAALVPADIQTWAASFTAAYVNASFAGGQVQGGAVQVIAPANRTSAMGQVPLVQTTRIIMTVNVTSKAVDPIGNQDPVSQFPVQVTFTDPGQVKLDTI